jgi:hypothetical protein
VAEARGADAPPLFPVVLKVFPVNSRLFWGYYCNFCLVCLEIVFCIVDVTKKKEKKRKERENNNRKRDLCVFVYFFYVCY